MYPTEAIPFGIFVKEQIEDASRYIDVDHDVYFINGVAEWVGRYYLKAVFMVPWKIMRG